MGMVVIDMEFVILFMLSTSYLVVSQVGVVIVPVWREPTGERLRVQAFAHEVGMVDPQRRGRVSGRHAQVPQADRLVEDACRVGFLAWV